MHVRAQTLSGYGAVVLIYACQINFVYCRQKENLTKSMSASGYREKVPPHIHEENVAKLSTLMQELLSLEEASQHLECDIAADASAEENA